MYTKDYTMQINLSKKLAYTKVTKNFTNTDTNYTPLKIITNTDTNNTTI